MDRPRLGGRVKSSSIIVPKSDATLQEGKPEYPPDDARAMSPRRNSEDLEKLGKEMRESLKEYVGYCISLVVLLTHFLVKHEHYNHHWQLSQKG